MFFLPGTTVNLRGTDCKGRRMLTRVVVVVSGNGREWAQVRFPSGKVGTVAPTRLESAA